MLFPCHMCSARVLKSKEPRLRDWNQRQLHSAERRIHLKSKEPRLRDWNQTNSEVPGLYVRLEIKRTSITRLKLVATRRGSISLLSNLKSKEPRLRDWNIVKPNCYCVVRSRLEIKRTSITRLKQTDNLIGRSLNVKPWNQKNLDYEIETAPGYCNNRRQINSLEIKRTSITRLKQEFYSSIARGAAAAWNQKNLDYEIETGIKCFSGMNCWVFLKSKEPRLRDWNIAHATTSSKVIISLKSKEPRLRDWNNFAHC